MTIFRHRSCDHWQAGAADNPSTGSPHGYDFAQAKPDPFMKEIQMPPGRGTKRTGRRLPARSPKVGRPEPGVVGRRAWAAGPNGTQWRKEIALVWRCNSHVGRPAHPAGDIASSTEKEGFLEDRRHSAKVIGFRHGQVYRSRCYTPCRLHSQRRLQLRLTLMRAYPFQASKRPHPRRHGVSEGHRPL
jgi:hypothetical protein